MICAAGQEQGNIGILVNMPKKSIKFIPEYLIPSLDNKTFGERLQWVDKRKNIFEIVWRHKAGPQWTEEEAQVFVEWDKHKGHFKPGNKEYYTQSKQRFRALLYKLTKESHLKELPSETKFKKVFCIGQKKNRRKKTDIQAEYGESSNEEEISSFIIEEISSEEHEYEDPDALICRKISEDDAVNVLEDHSYSVSDNLPGFFINSIENKQVILSNFQDTRVSTSSRESSADNFQKRVLVERNCDNMITLMPAIMTSLYTEDYSAVEGLKEEHENFILPLPAGKMPMDYLLDCQNALIPEDMLADTVNSVQLNMDSFDSYINKFLSEL